MTARLDRLGNMSDESVGECGRGKVLIAQYQMVQCGGSPIRVIFRAKMTFR